MALFVAGFQIACYVHSSQHHFCSCFLEWRLQDEFPGSVCKINDFFIFLQINGVNCYVFLGKGSATVAESLVFDPISDDFA